MCLGTTERSCRTADAPVECYKVVIKRDGPGFLSDIYGFLYELGKEPYKLGPPSGFPKSNPNRDKYRMMYINKGFHSFKLLRDAREYCDPYEGALPDDCGGCEVILKCVIPKGAHYWTGNYTNGWRKGYAEFCSDQLQVVAWKMRDDNCWRKYEKNKNWKTNKNTEKPCV